jgi:hypothetical protein
LHLPLNGSQRLQIIDIFRTFQPRLLPIQIYLYFQGTLSRCSLYLFSYSLLWPAGFFLHHLNSKPA